MIEWAGETYCNAKEAAALLKVSRGTFYNNLKDSVKAHELPIRKRLHYKLSEIESYRQVKVVKDAVA
ncbi:MAG TPA: hypothetical protein VL461_11570 [Dictyobacter sp.]|jgi:hypothetical protein|nr:hypothetical protein [Dictyobacter sp.]